VKAVVFKEPFKLAVENVDDPKIEQPGDAVIRITTANICGSDLHPYEGRAPLEAGMVLGHENMGIVEETGPGVNRVMRAGPRLPGFENGFGWQSARRGGTVKGSTL
jgi:glutathione-independent formaldehyde dehydrogenase